MGTVAEAGPLPVRPVLPRVARIIGWLLDQQHLIESIDNGQLVIDWGATTMKGRVTQTSAIPLAPAELVS